MVADGVGGYGVGDNMDPAKFAWTVVKGILDRALAQPTGGLAELLTTGKEAAMEATVPGGALEAAVRSSRPRAGPDEHRAASGLVKPAGGTTVTLVAFSNATGTLESINFGDSGYVVCRNGSVVYYEQPQQVRPQLLPFQSGRRRRVC